MTLCNNFLMMSHLHLRPASLSMMACAHMSLWTQLMSPTTVVACGWFKGVVGLLVPPKNNISNKAPMADFRQNSLFYTRNAFVS